MNAREIIWPDTVIGVAEEEKEKWRERKQTNPQEIATNLKKSYENCKFIDPRVSTNSKYKKQKEHYTEAHYNQIAQNTAYYKRSEGGSTFLYREDWNKIFGIPKIKKNITEFIIGKKIAMVWAFPLKLPMKVYCLRRSINRCFKNICLILFHICVLPECKCMVCVWCPWRAEEGTRSPWELEV